ncbi:protein STRUBBELIG-RECEPTOR FAMILY 2-like [Rutidosis leptorrhynchoides]|uniref:protein STRUBBELIG-RECEPTOR FAMILY 2-like n=1 Tax=Rutidosis leptorrhynchoides TaxID=125765 RepID=UPI003A99493F
MIASESVALTDPLDVSALKELYKALNKPVELKGWRLDAGVDPCGESWEGVSCAGSSVIYITLRGLNLTGSLGYHLSDFQSLKHLDLSCNRIQGDIPNTLPLNATHINLAFNNLSQSIPHSLSLLKHIRILNLSHNELSGPIGDIFSGLPNLKEIDLSFNSFSGDLPSCFLSLSSLGRLFLQNNKFTGSVDYLSNLPLYDLNIQENNFSGVLPNNFQYIANLWIGGNKFHTGGDYPPWNFPTETVPIDRNISGPPRTQSSAIESHPSSIPAAKHKKRKIGSGGIASLVGALVLVAAVAAIFAIVHYQSSARKAKNQHGDNSNAILNSLPIKEAQGTFINSIIHDARHEQKHTRDEKKSRRSFSGPSRKSKAPVSAKVYTVAELQLATNSFSEEHLIGEGSFGPVYKAEFPDGQIMVVKIINLASLSFQEEEQFLDVVWTASRLRHPNIVPLVGYSMDHGQHLLVYEYIRNLSLNDVLHNGSLEPLSWEIRLNIALDVARALDYMHSKFSAPVAHGNIKASNILLDEVMVPHICDSGIAVLRPLTKLKASEIASEDTAFGYVSPEHGQHEADNIKSDIYAFGVLLLELLTGRKPFDSSRTRQEKSLVKWASSRLHDAECLEQMVDPVIKSTLCSRTLSRFADVVLFCIQAEKKFRLPMSQVVGSLTHLSQMGSDGPEADSFERSFRSSYTGFIGSPA